VTTKTGLLNTPGRRPSDRELVVWLLWTVALVCGWIWARGLFLALAAGPGQQVAAPNPASWEDLSAVILRDPFHPYQALSILLGSSRAHRLEAWASSSYVLGVIGEVAFLLSLYLRKKAWTRLPKPS
jgi:hypothetical protein